MTDMWNIYECEKQLAVGNILESLAGLACPDLGEDLVNLKTKNK